MYKDVMMLSGIVLVVVTVGFYTLLPGGLSGGATGMVVSGGLSLKDNAPDCARCFGSPVCAAKGQRVSNYDNACDAVCNGARVVYDDYCENIPAVKW